MKLLKVKTARFADVVERCGQPEVYTLWQKPKTDRHLQSLIKNVRVMTVRASDSGTEFGEVGFHEKKGASFLEFPKSLRRFAEKRIVGIKWDLVKT
ncbi:MAG: hypothetical protein ACJ8IQ_11495 [Chthoniobacterales bacterium]